MDARRARMEEREFGAFERGLMLGFALAEGLVPDMQEVADLLGYRSSNSAHKAMSRCRLWQVHREEEGGIIRIRYVKVGEEG